MEGKEGGALEGEGVGEGVGERVGDQRSQELTQWTMRQSWFDLSDITWLLISCLEERFSNNIIRFSVNKANSISFTELCIVS